jgi:hypothetical protein
MGLCELCSAESPNLSLELCPECRKKYWVRYQLKLASAQVDEWPQWMKNALAEERMARK